MQTVNTYTLQQDNQDIVDYVSDELNGYRVVMQAVQTYADEKEYWRVEGLIMKNNEIIADFLPSSRTLWGNKEKAVDQLEKIVTTYEPVHALQDEGFINQ